MDNGQYINLIARIEAIKAEIEAAKLDNAMRLLNANGASCDLNYSPQWFNERADELLRIAAEPFQ